MLALEPIRRGRRIVWSIVAVLVVTACSSDPEAATDTDTPPSATVTTDDDEHTTAPVTATSASTSAPATPTTTPTTRPTTTPTTTPTDTTATTATTATTTTSVAVTTDLVGDALDLRGLVEALASDELNGRDNQSPGSAAAREILIGELSRFAEPAVTTAEDKGYIQAFDVGTNVLGLISGRELADEYVMIGAHYDHLGPGQCDAIGEPDDVICNGATDNAASVAEVIEIGRSIAAAGTPRRSVIIALWDAEEDGLIGSRRYVENPVVPLDQTIAYVNFDNQGLNLTPGLADWTIAVGAETGGSALVDAAERAAAASTLNTASFSLLFGQGRSDHAVLASAGVPVVFFTDATDGCYHTVRDDITNVDFGKLEQQVARGAALARDLVETETPPVFDAEASTVAFGDAVQMQRIVDAARADLPLFPVDAGGRVETFGQDLREIVESGPNAFDDAAIATLVAGAADLVQILDDSECGIA